MRKSFWLVLLSAAVAAALVAPAPVFGVDTYATDMYEPGDNSPGLGTTDVTAMFAAGPVGGTLQLQAHTISAASATNPWNYDQDWFKFTVTDTDLAARTSYLIEADSRATIGAYRIIEVYDSEGMTPSDPPLEESGDWYNPTLTRCLAPLQPPFGDWWHDDNGVQTVCFEPTAAGVYYFRVRPWRSAVYGYPSDYYGSTAGPYTLRLKKGFFSRAFGMDRVRTAIQVSQELYPPAALTNPGSDAWGESVVVANGWNYPDALAGSALAGQLNAPLLLTTPASLPIAVRDEVNRLRPRYIYILGGDTAVYPAVETALAALPAGAPATVTRIDGVNRSETAKKIAQKLFTDGGSTGIGPAFLVNGWNYPDALSAAPMAAFRHAPILLTHTSSLDSYAQMAIALYGVTDVVILGDEHAVSSAVETQVASLLHGFDHVRRIQGRDRYETSYNMALWESGLLDGGADWVGTVANPNMFQALEPNQIGIASGANFPDALTGGVWCGRSFAPLLLTPPSYVSPYVYSLSTHKTPTGAWDYWKRVKDATGKGFHRSYVFGSGSTITTPTYTALDSYSGLGGH